MRVAVTGGAGFVGSHAAEALSASGAEVLAIDDLSSGRESNLPAGVEFARMSISDPGLAGVLSSFGAEAIVHCAAQASVAVSVERPARDAEVNIIGGLGVMAACAPAGVRRFVYVNTGGALYGEPESLPCAEDHPIRPISPYGLSKWTLEAYLQMLLPPQVSLVSLRLGNVYGPRQDPAGEAGVVAIFAGLMLAGREVRVFGDGEQTRDFVYAADVARAIGAALERGDRTSVNIGSGRPTSVNRIFGVLAGLTGYDRGPVREPGRPGDVRHIHLDVARARRELGWTAETPLEDGLRMTVDSMRAG